MTSNGVSGYQFRKDMDAIAFVPNFTRTGHVTLFKTHHPLCAPPGNSHSSRWQSKPCLRMPRRYLTSRSAYDDALKLEEFKKKPRTPSLGSQPGTIALCAANISIYAADHLAKWPLIARLLYLHHGRMQWFQVLTSLFCHASWAHLSGNLFFLLVFGRLVEEESGAFGVWFTYLFCGAIANLLVLTFIPSASAGAGAALTVSLGASGSVFALFVLAVLTRFRFTIARIVETFIMGAFVSERVKEEVRMIASGGGKISGGIKVNHWAHLGGAFAGAILVMMVRWVGKQEKLREEADLKGKAQIDA